MTPTRSVRRGRRLLAGAAALLGLTSAASAEPLHYATNISGDFENVRRVGFNLVDIGSAATLDILPDGVRGVLWLGNGYNKDCSWRLSDAEIEAAVTAARHHPRFSGVYYIADEPHPATCPDAPKKVAERSALVRSLDPDARTMILVQNGSSAPDEFAQMGASADLIGVDPYPCNVRNVETGCDIKALRARIEAALDAGIAPERIIPVFQTFGQSCVEMESAYYRLPRVEEMREMLAVWDEMVPPDRRPLDMAYTWGSQSGTSCPGLSMADGGEHPDLQGLLSEYFEEMREGEFASNRHD